MTVKEAIKTLDLVPEDYMQPRLLEAFTLAKQVLREKLERDRRYEVTEYEFGGKMYYAVSDKTRKDRVAGAITHNDAGKAAAKAIADMYEEMGDE